VSLPGRSSAGRANTGLTELGLQRAKLRALQRWGAVGKGTVGAAEEPWFLALAFACSDLQLLSFLLSVGGEAARGTKPFLWGLSFPS